ncbi:aminoacyl-histidine dipeptidase [Plebeiibacterium sediminum]|uniref:Cytosol non-specific dipeptidase n=1 Tax=Plebeiibacterium sediminum TaxID=2992112 RepID=A0AAE3SEQ3_9BACT|nr:aminoacyl-histidine dipeptidase [Plebeiobacterium sediminum]MCW3785373.1 aminoacyl-histidine dipeptidase [Plebeiobacterium sediminum]
MNSLNKLVPTDIWGYFQEICKVPRPSKKEEHIIQYLINFAEEHQLEYKKDEIGNILIKKPASLNCEEAPSVVLQSHMDMVCEKHSHVKHDFEKDAIIPVIEDGWVKASGTTLGADDGIGIAAQLAVLASNEIKHGPIECLFTVDEETGLTGAFNLKDGFFESKILLNLDSEDEGELFIGCAGGLDTVATFDIEKEEVPEKYFAINLQISGLKGGHSGDDIDKGLGNAVKLLNRFLWQAGREYNLRVYSFTGGNLRNAIAREASAIAVVPASQKEPIRVAFNIFYDEVCSELELTEPGIKMHLESCDIPEYIWTKPFQTNFLNAIYTCPHGVIEMSRKIEGLVETSTNLASIKQVDEQVVVSTSQRSSVETAKENVAAMVRSSFELAGAEVKHGEGYPGWEPNTDSQILRITRDSYEELFQTKPIVRAIHAGLECGLFLEKYPGLDMISFGPTIKGAHSPDERLEIETVQKFWDHLLDVLSKIVQEAV